MRPCRRDRSAGCSTRGRTDAGATPQENAIALESARRLLQEIREPRSRTSRRRVAVGSTTIGRATFRGDRPTAQHVRLAMPTSCATGRRRHRARARADARQAPARCSTPRACSTRCRIRLSAALDSGIHIERSTSGSSRTATVRPATTFDAGDLVRVTLTLDADERAPLRRGQRSAARRLRAGRVWFAHDGVRSRQRRVGRAERIGGQLGVRGGERGGFDHVEKSRRSRALFATRLGEGRHEFSYRRARDDTRAPSVRPGRRRKRCTNRKSTGERHP